MRIPSINTIDFLGPLVVHVCIFINPTCVYPRGAYTEISCVDTIKKMVILCCVVLCCVDSLRIVY